MAGIMAGYDINFARYIRYDIQELSFREITHILFLCWIQRLCDTIAVRALPDVDQLIKVTHVVDVRFILDRINLVAQRNAKSSTSSRETYLRVS